MTTSTGHLRVRPTAVAGTFYPAAPERLAESLRASFAAAHQPEGDLPLPKAIVVPHAGYVFSGPIAASAYLRLVPGRTTITRVVLLGPSHYVHFHGLAVSTADALATPLGLVRIDAGARRDALALPAVLSLIHI